MKASRNGEFSVYIESEVLSKGLRPSKRVVRNTKYLVRSIGAVGRDQVLQVIDDLEENRIDTSIITDGFPYPQIFIFPAFTIICGETDIYEYDGVMNLMFTASAGDLWSVAEFFEYIYMSNGVESIVRDPTAKTYSYALLPAASAICNYNGQVMIGVNSVTI